MLGEIFGRSAGEMVADVVLPLFLPLRAVPGLLSILCGLLNPSSGPALGSMVRGVLLALPLVVVPESVGVAWSSLLGWTRVGSELLVGTGAAASGSIMSSRLSSGIVDVGSTSLPLPGLLLGKDISAIGVTPLPESCRPRPSIRGDLSAAGTGGGRIRDSESGSGETESSLLRAALAKTCAGMERPG